MSATSRNTGKRIPSDDATVASIELVQEAADRDRELTVTSGATKKSRSIKIYNSTRNYKSDWGQSAGFHRVTHEGLVYLHSTVCARRKMWYDN
jgi:hypothetical protein